MPWNHTFFYKVRTWNFQVHFSRGDFQVQNVEISKFAAKGGQINHKGYPLWFGGRVRGGPLIRAEGAKIWEFPSSWTWKLNLGIFTLFPSSLKWKKRYAWNHFSRLALNTSTRLSARGLSTRCHSSQLAILQPCTGTPHPSRIWSSVFSGMASILSCNSCFSIRRLSWRIGSRAPLFSVQALWERLSSS